MSANLLDVDIEATHRLIHEHDRAIQLLDSEIEDLLKTVRQLQFEKNQHQVEIIKCKGRITLASRLPPEILASIFELCVLDGRTRTPLVVSHVCASWRKAAFIPTVWSHVYINLDSRDPRPRTQLWLKRSLDTLLTIEFKIGSDMSHLDSIMELLGMEARRWKTLIVNSSYLGPINHILQACDKPAPQLCKIELLIDQELFFTAPHTIDNSENEIEGLHALSLKAPNLQSLRIHRNILPGPNTLPSFITDLTLQLPCKHSPSTDQPMLAIIRLLEDLHDLEIFVLEVPCADRQQFQLNAQIDHKVYLSKLNSLTIMGANNIFGLLPHLKTPILSHLVLRSSLDSVQSQENGAWVLELLQGSSPPITLLDVRDLALDPVAYNRIFQLLPQLKELRLHDSDILDHNLQQLHGPHGSCPLLQRLDLRWCGRLTGRALVDLVKSRFAKPVTSESVSPTSISEITLINCSFVKEDDILDIAEMTICRLIHRGQTDFCYPYACCDNERYRRRLKQRSLFHPSIRQKHAAFRLLF